MVSRRSLLKISGVTTVVGGTVVGAASLQSNDGSDENERNESDDSLADTVDVQRENAELIEIDYSEHSRPEDAYRVWTGQPNRMSFDDSVAFDGEKSLRCDILKETSNGTNAAYWFPANGYGQPNKVRQRSMIRLSEDWTMEENDVCRFWTAGLNTEAGPHGSGGRGRPSGNDGWSIMLAVTDRRNGENSGYNLATYTYHMDQSGSTGEFEVVDSPVHSGEWFELETEVVMNTVSDGEADPNGKGRYWLNGELVYERTDFRWTTVDEQAIEYAGPLVRYGGSEVAPIDLTVFYDEHELFAAGIPEIPPYENNPYFEDPANLDDYDGRVTYVNGDEESTYRLYIDGFVAHSNWSNVDGHQSKYNETVQITPADESESGYAIAEATAKPHTADGYLFNGEFVALDADPDPAELWISGDQVDPATVPSSPEDA
ncbi:heparin lyase I family protein [Natronorubrum thiooxidans]|uniref:Polysaccharide lyase n=1 Tax=Natronorubrum thiooxidans TaxID=308853 RepID=A0A1N7FS41_9EURY|nr:hypothetical protein SAMN05421752_10823 [Natronorubrum thiooxidans]